MQRFWQRQVIEPHLSLVLAHHALIHLDTLRGAGVREWILCALSARNIDRQLANLQRENPFRVQGLAIFTSKVERALYSSRGRSRDRVVQGICIVSSIFTCAKVATALSCFLWSR